MFLLPLLSNKDAEGEYCIGKESIVKKQVEMRLKLQANRDRFEQAEHCHYRCYSSIGIMTIVDRTGYSFRHVVVGVTTM